MRAQAGDGEALGELFRRFGGRVVRFAERRTGSPSVADDVAVEVFERAWRSIDSLDDPDRILPWLLRIAARSLVDRHRSEDRRRRREVRADQAVTALRPSTDPAELVIDAGGVEADTLRRALDRLSGTHQEIVMLRFHADLTPAEAAAALGITTSAAGVRLHRALAAVRLELARGGTADE